MLTGLNHLTLAVQALPRSIDFYTQALGCRLHARWDTGAYLELGALWICLSLDPQRKPCATPPDYTHYAFSVAAENFAAFVAHAQAWGVHEWKRNHSEGDSFYFLDPDGHALEAHVGTLSSRLVACRSQPYAGMVFSD